MRHLRSASTTSSTKIGSETRIPVKKLARPASPQETLAETIRNIADNITLALNTPSKRLSSQFRTPDTSAWLILDRAPTGVPTFVMRWVDYTGKYGLAYQLSNSLAGMYFNDSTSILLSSEGGTFDYLSSTGESTSGVVGQHPPDLEKKVKLALRYKGYMTDNLHGTNLHTSQQHPGEKVFLADFLRVANAVLFRMSDNVVQVTSLPDVWADGRLILRIMRR